MGEFDNVKSIVGNDIFSLIPTYPILVVGGGGIGCEVIKCLALCGFLNITIIDLDTIDVSNLNRQFLFRRKHVGKSKSIVVANEGNEISKNCRYKSNDETKINIIGLVGNIKDYNADFFNQFKVVLNALDNVDARRYVNRLCLSSGVKLIDAGSTGYNGQVHPIIPRETTCYECRPPPVPKSYAVCTIRSTPEKPEHCITWSKYLFELAFGLRGKNGTNSENLLNDMAAHIQFPLDEEISEIKIRKYTEKMFNYLFHDEIVKSCENKQLWEGKKRELPKPLHWNAEMIFGERWKENLNEKTQCKFVDNIVIPSQRVLSIFEYAKMFYHSIEKLLSEKYDEIGTSSMEFDKDNEVCMEFVTASCNLRCYNFNIPLQSYWTCQSIAGSIIPAIASTNAIVAGVQVLQLLILMSRDLTIKKENLMENNIGNKLNYGKSRFVWIKNSPMGRYLLCPEELEQSSSRCLACSQQLVTVTIRSFSRWTLQQFVKDILSRHLGLIDPFIEFDQKCIWDPDEMEQGKFLQTSGQKTLQEWKFMNGKILTVTDYSQGEFQCDVLVQIDELLSDTSNTKVFLNNTTDEPYKIVIGSLKSADQNKLLNDIEGSENDIDEIAINTINQSHKRQKIDKNDDELSIRQVRQKIDQNST
ncbi:ubiquitin-activating enzyme [Cryptosporidium andersoni]|uniref:SUMO-activating enzyme subunit n=1 Tax=Cryptosporidium andersoni TaxID=117008 RepID=A0A1J4MQ51_9CRYT|nr:ubiquitin-activating enzyme [Cryptosporidium andersoni]